MKNVLGFNGTKEEIISIWAKNAESWFSAGSPWRPSASDIEIYKNLCGSKIFGKVLILGSTSELRDLIASEGNKSPVLVDVSSAMLEKMSLLLKRANSADEVWVKSDWCEAPLPESYFDLVIGDMVWWVVSVSYQFKLRDKIASLLKPDGLFISRFRLKGAGSESADPYTVIKEYLKKFDANLQNKVFVRNAMMSRLYDITADVEKKRLNREKVKKILFEAVENTLDLKHKDFISEAASRLLSADWTSQTRDEILPVLANRLRIISEMRASDYESEFYPIFSFVKK